MSAGALPRGNRLADLRALSQALAAQPEGLADLQPDRLGPLAQRIADLCDRLERASGPPTPAERRLAAAIGTRARAAQRRLAVQIAGLRDAQTVLGGARAGACTRTYGPGGEALPLDPPRGRLERRS